MSEVSAGRSLAYYAAEVGLTAKQRAFVEAYLADPQRNQTLAATKAGYADPITQSYEVLKSPKIRQFLDLADKKITQVAEKRFNVAVMKPAELRARLSDQGRGSLMQFVQDDGTFNVKAVQEQDRGHLVKKFSMSTITKQVGEVKVTETEVRAEPADPQGALKELASHYGMSKDKNQVQPQINFLNVVQQMQPEEKAALSRGLEHLYRAMLSTGNVVDVEGEET